MRSSNGLAGGVGGTRWFPLAANAAPPQQQSVASTIVNERQLGDQTRADLLAKIELETLDQSKISASSTNSANEGLNQQVRQTHQATTWTDNLSHCWQLDWTRQVRQLIAQHSLETISICVIIIYLVYFFTRVSRKPRLIGHKESKFVNAIQSQFRDIIESRFNPLIYFWGTNPQTCLFGYLNGNESTDEMPRSKFKRQFLFVSDAQYLTSNVDLSRYYERRQQTELASSKHNSNARKCHSKLSRASNQMRENLRLAIENNQENHLQDISIETKQQNVFSQTNESTAAKLKSDQQINVESTTKHHSLKHQFSSGSSSSGSDSGVFAACQTSSSTSSSSLTIDMSSSSSSTSASSASSSPSASSSADRLATKLKNDNNNNSSKTCSCTTLYSNDQQLGAPINLPDYNTTQATPINNKNLNQHVTSGTQFAPEQLEFGQCALDWHTDSHRNYHQNKQVALISAGMTTGSDKKYVTDTVSTLERLGYEVCVFIRRGVGGLKLSSTRFFSPSKWRDFEAAVWSVRRQRPDARLVAIGFSFGSIELCRYLSMSGPNSLVDFALLISCPFDPEAGGRNMRKRALNRKIDAYLAENLGKQLYQAMFLGSPMQQDQEEAVENLQSDQTNLENNPQKQENSHRQIKIIENAKLEKPTDFFIKQQLQIHQSHNQLETLVYSNYNGSTVDLSRLPKIKSLVDFEDNYNRILQNYPNSDAYAQDSRLNDQLANIETPTLCLSSEDDFMAPLKLLPLQQIEQNKNLCMILTKRGGHMAFIDGLVWPRKPYFAQRIISKYIETISLVMNDSCANDIINHHHNGSEIEVDSDEMEGQLKDIGDINNGHNNTDSSNSNNNEINNHQNQRDTMINNNNHHHNHHQHQQQRIESNLNDHDLHRHIYQE